MATRLIPWIFAASMIDSIRLLSVDVVRNTRSDMIS